MGGKGGAAKIGIVTGASLAWNPRALKEARALASAGFNVVVYGSSSDQSGFERDNALASRHGFTFRCVFPTWSGSPEVRLRRILEKTRNRASRSLFRLTGMESRWQLGPLVAELFRQASAASADYYIVHLEQAAWAGTRLLRQGVRVGVDVEDWYSEDLLPEAKRSRPARLLRELEGTLLRQGSHATCPSYEMSEALARAYRCPPPAVVYNAFPWSDRNSLDGAAKDRKGSPIPSVHWFSQTMGPGRGLEDLLSALQFVKYDIEIHLRGTPVSAFDAWLSKNVPAGWRNKIFLHNVVPNEDLLSRISEHDIGFAGEMQYCRNKDLTVSNKMLHYLLGGLAVVASDTTGQREVAERATGAVFLYQPGDPQDLATHLNRLLGSKEGLARAKNAALKIAQMTYCWERQEKVLLDVVTRALGEPRGRQAEAG